MISDLRNEYHKRLCSEVIRINSVKDGSHINFADKDSKSSRSISEKIIQYIGIPIITGKENEQTVGNLFEDITKDFLEKSFGLLQHIRPGKWVYSTNQTEISRFDQFEHLASIAEKIEGDKDLASAIGRDYLVKPDIIIARYPLSDDDINKNEQVINKNEASTLTPLREANSFSTQKQILHASISCKWTIRSDRSQNTRTEALNLIRNRKGNLPHIVAVTAEPLPNRIATLALGTGDLDCVYHFALYELEKAVHDLKNDDQKEMLDILVNGRRLRDISDLPFDIAV